MKDLEKLIIKYFEDTLNQEETKRFKRLLEEDKNRAYFREFVHLNHLINSKTAFNYENELGQFRSRTNQDFRFTSILKYAAAILIFVSAGYFFLTKEKFVDKSNPIMVNSNISVGTDKAILTLENGTNVALEKGQNYITDNLTSNGEELVYKSLSEPKAEIAYNYLTIPRGGQYFVKLSDGTQVWLNSESKLKYPVNFIKGEIREVELVYGEAYFDVSPSTNHNGDRFKVDHRTQEVEVLGTEFNIKAYRDETNIYTTLVEGKVKVNRSDNEIVLQPGEQTKVNDVNDVIVSNKVDIMYETAWKNGVFRFKNESLGNMMKTLSRWYNIKIVFENEEKETMIFSGSLKRTDNIENLLEKIEKAGDVKFEINTNELRIK